MAMKYKLGLIKILGAIYIYPTLAEANKAAAGFGREMHAPNDCSIGSPGIFAAG